MSFFSNIQLVSDYLTVSSSDTIHFEPTYHQVAQAFGKWPVVTNEDGYKIKLFEWGVIADYMNTPEKIKEYRTSMANARSEKIIDDKRSVWHRIRKNRCLVFTTGFFEHRDIGGKKKLPYFIKVKNEKVFCFAGLYNYSPLPEPETGEAIGTFAIITRPGNSMMNKIHNAGPNSHRMPLILSKELALKWLESNLSDAEMNKVIHYEFPENEMEAWPVNTIRTRKENNRNIIERLDESLYPAL
jgi:putative SOS response-associated peptidase YedK